MIAISDRKIHSRPYVHEWGEALVQEEIMSAEEERNSRELITVDIAVTYTKPNTELLIDKPFVKIMGRDDVAPRLSKTFPRGDINYIQTSFIRVE